jgi:8-oxo-dGTP pyrophosphatase MutT (NUDIX family)
MEEDLSLNYRSGVLAVIYREDKFLLIRKNGRPEDEWYFAAGGKENAESAETTFYREMNEELGIEPKDLKNIQITDIIHRYTWGENMKEKTGFDGQAQKVVFAELKDGDRVTVNDKEEIDSFRFESAEELVSTLPFQNLKDLVQDLKKASESPPVFDKV